MLTNQSVQFKFSFIQGATTNAAVYTETHSVTTDDLGQVSLVLGKGTPVTGTFSTIDWSKSPYFLSIELNSGAGFVTLGTTQFMSVPYAQFAGTAGATTSNRIVRGTLSAGGGSIISGSGFKISSTTTKGIYNVTFDTPYTSIPSVLTSEYITINLSTYYTSVIKVSNLTTTGFTIYTLRDGSPVGDLGFTFIAVGE